MKTAAEKFTRNGALVILMSILLIMISMPLPCRAYYFPDRSGELPGGKMNPALTALFVAGLGLVGIALVMSMAQHSHKVQPAAVMDSTNSGRRVQCKEGAFSLADTWSTFRTRINGYCVDWGTHKFIGYLADGDSLIRPIDQVYDLKDSVGHRITLAPSPLPAAPTDSLYDALKRKPLNEMTDREYQYFMVKKPTPNVSNALLADAQTEKVQCQEGAFSLGDLSSSFRTRIKGYCVNWATHKFIGYLADGDSLIKPLSRINDLRDSRGHRIVLAPPPLTVAPTDSLYEVLKRKPLNEMTDREYEYFMLKKTAEM
jgi:hypothetical protein